jgi:HSP20 family protein
VFGRSLFRGFLDKNAPTEARQDPLSTLQQEMNRGFDSFRTFPAGRWSNAMVPNLDGSVTDKPIEIEAELPGLDEKNVDVTLAGEVLTIRGERKNSQEERGKNYHVTERWGRFTRSVTLPFDVDPKDVTASFHKGVLHISIRKPDGISARSAKIPVQTAATPAAA